MDCQFTGKGKRAHSPYQLFRKPTDVPLAESLDIFDLNLEAAKIVRGDCVEGDIEEYERPLEEGVDGVC